MALISRVPAIDVGAALARALEQLLGHDVMFTVGPPAFGDPNPATLPEEPTRSVALPFSNGVVGEVTLVVAEHLATAMEAASADASLTTAAVIVLAAAAGAIEAVVPVGAQPDWADEIATDTLLTSVVGEFVIVPVLENDVRVASVVVRMVDNGAPVPVAPVVEVAPPATPTLSPPPVASPAPAPAPIPAPPVGMPEALPAAPADGASAPGTIARHEFQVLPETNVGAGPTRSLTLLNDVHVQVTAELGRRQLKVREIMALSPGAVIELDKAAGSPIDVLVNGAIVWHGEVVVVDDEFGIRVSEIVVDDI